MTEALDPAIERRAARVLLVDAEHRVLLFHGRDPVYDDRGSWWFTPGGGLDPGESPHDGAARELFEETGLRLAAADLGEVVHRRVTRFPWGDDVYAQEEDYFLVRVGSMQVDTSGFNEVETASVLGHRWWSREELLATDEVYYPRNLVELLP